MSTMRHLIDKHSTDELRFPAPPNPRKVIVFIGAGMVVLLAMAAILTNVLSHRSATSTAVKAQPPISATVTTQVAGFMPIESHVSASGSVAARHAVDIGTEVSGLRIVQVNVDEGDHVRAGQVIARLDSAVLQSQLSQQMAVLAGKQANLSKARQPNRSEDIAGLRAALAQAEAGVTQAERSLQHAQLNASNLATTANRYSYLGQQGAVSQQDALDKQTAAKMATTDVEASKQQLSAAKFAATQARERYKAALAGGRSEDIAMVQSDVGATRAMINQVQAQIDQTIIRAPSDGLITKRMAEVGGIAMVGQPLFSMTSNDQIELQAQVQEVDLPAIRAGQGVLISPASSQLTPVAGTVRDVSPRVDARTRFGIAYIPVSPASGLKEGMYANAQIRTGTHNAIAVPTKSILVQDAGKFVYVVPFGSDRVSMRSVQTGEVTGDYTEVLSGVQPGERVVTAGAGFLKDGDRVMVR
jgi:multidrug efflux pump subunit AcrA (membrane-fusion protein)